MGGEITWECLGSGQYIFEMRLYRDCSGETPDNSYNLNVYNHPSISQITVNLNFSEDITPTCNGASFSCNNGNVGATEQYVYRSSPITIDGVPPAEGYIFTYNECCRNGSIDNIPNASTRGMTLRAVMYPFNGQSVATCYDSSPYFNAIPPTIVCSSLPVKYNHDVVDADLDSLVFDWAHPIDTSGASNCSPFVLQEPCINQMTFNNGYSYDSPLPGTSLHPSNVPATINPNNGEIAYTSFISGNYVTVVGAKAYRCGQLIAEVYREIQVVILDCNANDMPTHTAPFLDNSGNLTSYYDTVQAGELVSFDMTFYDDDLFPNSSPQTLTLEASGSQFGTNFINPSAGCLNSPCATLSSALPVSSSDSVSTTFTWQTSCAHVGNVPSCNTAPTTYQFIISASDDFCPAPAKSVATINVTVLPSPPIESAEITCLGYVNSTDVTMEWSQPLDTTGDFNAYQFFYSVDGMNSFNSFNVSSYGQTSNIHLGVGSASGPVYYYTNTLSGCFGDDVSENSDTLSTVFLTGVGDGGQIIDLNWNSPYIDEPDSSSLIFTVQRRILGGAWMDVNTTNQLSLIDTALYCDDQIQYRLEYQFPGGCTAYSNVVQVDVYDNINPITPVLDSVSVDIVSNLSTLGWESSTSPDVAGYIVYKFNGTVWVPVDTVYGVNNNTYQFALSSAASQKEYFRVAALDSCDNTSPMGVVHSSINLQLSLNKCSEEFELSWNAYQGWDQIDGYQVFQSVDNGPYQLIGTVAGSDSTFNYAATLDSAYYCFYVRAFDSVTGRTSTSNLYCGTFEFFKDSRFTYVSKVSVVDETTIDLFVYTDSLSSISTYHIWRKSEIGDQFFLIDSLANLGIGLYHFIDTYNVNTQYYHYTYKIEAIDSCGQIADTSQTVRTMRLLTEPLRTSENRLNFTEYLEWPQGVETYRIWRAVDEVYETLPIYEGPYVNEYMDNIESFNEGLGGFCYQVEAIEQDGNSFGFKSFSWSNESCVKQFPKINIPNAFAPDGEHNPIFRPYSLYINPDEFVMNISDRYGTLMFTTTDMYGGWNGEVNGKPVPIGVYLYEMKFMTTQGEEVNMWGTVTLVR